MISFFIDEPVSLSLKSETCFGGSFCLIGESLELNLHLNQEAKMKPGFNKATLYSNALISGSEKVNLNSNETSISIPIKTSPSIGENTYSFSLDSSYASYSNNIYNLLLWIKHLFMKSSIKETIDFRYPSLTFTINDYQCHKKQGNYYFETILLEYKDKSPFSLKCKIRIGVDEDTITRHSLLGKVEDGEIYDFYETEYSYLTFENGLPIQQIKFNTNVDTQITNTYIVPVCEIEGNEVIIKNAKEDYGDCQVK